MEKITPKNEAIAKAFAAPFILRILKHFTAEDLSYAIENNLNIVKWLKENTSALASLRWMFTVIPFADKALEKTLPNIRSKPWVKWFINNELAHKRRDLYLVFLYNPHAFGWLHRNMVRLSKFLGE